MSSSTDPHDPPIRGRSFNQARLVEHVLEVADGLFQSAGYQAVTMEQVAAAAEVSKRTLYKYFPVKEALLARLLEDELARDLARPDFQFDHDAPFRTKVSALLAESAAWCEAHPDVLLPYIRYKFASFRPEIGKAPQDKPDLVQTWGLLIGAAQARGELAASPAAADLAIYFHYLYLGALMRWLTDRRLDLKTEFATVVRLFVDGTGARG